jgi:hypothetical protein
MKLSINDLEQISKQSPTSIENTNFHDLTENAHTLALELSTYIGYPIVIGVVPRNEKKYTLKEFTFFMVEDGYYNLAPSLELILTVSDKENAVISFSFPYITSIKSNLLPDGLKYWIEVKNRVFDSVFSRKGEWAHGISSETQKFISDYRYTDYRFILLRE